MCVLFSYKAKEQDLLIPVVKSEVGDEYEGATVIDPVKGLIFDYNKIVFFLLI